jgi:hypothetical protein
VGEDFIFYRKDDYRVGVRYKATFDRWKDTIFGKLFRRK